RAEDGHRARTGRCRGRQGSGASRAGSRFRVCHGHAARPFPRRPACRPASAHRASYQHPGAPCGCPGISGSRVPAKLSARHAGAAAHTIAASRVKEDRPMAIVAKPGRRLDPEDAEQALSEVQHLLRRQQVVQELVHRQEEGSEHAGVIESILQRTQDAELQALLQGLHPADIAFILESLPRDERQHVWQLVKAEHDGEVLLEVGDSVRESLIEVMDRKDLVAATENLDADELADLASDLPPDVVAEVQQGLTAEERARLSAAMSFPEDTVGAIMDFDMVRVRDDVTLEVVLRYLRRLPELPDHTDQIFVVDRHERLQGTLYVTRILVSEPEKRVADVMDSDMLTLQPYDEADDAARAFERYDLVSA